MDRASNVLKFSHVRPMLFLVVELMGSFAIAIDNTDFV